MKALILVLLFLYFPKLSYGDYLGDFIVRNASGSSINVTFQVASVPFEGSIDSSLINQIRVGQIQAGWLFKYTNSVLYPIGLKHAVGTGSGSGVMLDMGHCNSTELSMPPA